MAESICLKCQAIKPDDGFKWCQTCRRIQQEYNAKHRQRINDGTSRKYGAAYEITKIKTKRRRKKPKKTFDEVLRDVDAYNKKHGTHLSYGKYKALERQGKL